MSTYTELNKVYQELFKTSKDFPRATLSRWVKNKEISYTYNNNGTYNYDISSFKEKIQSEEYMKQYYSKLISPETYIGTTVGNLEITGLVPKEEYKEPNYKGTLVYCNCLKCGKKNIQVRFTYITGNTNYTQESCGCLRKQKAFLASCRYGITQDFLNEFDGKFELFLFVHKMITSSVTNGYYASCPIEEYKQAIYTIIEDEQFLAIYDFWQRQERTNTYYDWSKPSLDHIIPKSKGGNHYITNLQVLTVFENLAKRDMTMEEWTFFKKQTNTVSDFFVENIVEKRRENIG